MSSPLQRYRDNVTGFSTSNQDFFDQTGLPPPHALSGPDDPYASNSNLPQSPDAPLRGSITPDMSARGYNNMDNGVPYNSGGSQWLEKQQSSSRKSKWIVVGSLAFIIVAVVVGVAVGVTVSKSHSKSSSDLASSSSSADTGNSTSVVNQTNPNDPSTFVLDPALKHSFYGLAYTPAGSQLPDCGNSLDAVIEDIQLISQLTSRIRLYGSDCNQSALVLDAIDRTKVNVSVYLGNYNVPTDGGASYLRQRNTMQQALEDFGVDHVLGVTVGNEWMLNWLDANDGGDEPNGAIGNEGAQLLIPNITDTRNMIASLNLTLPVGTADAGSFFNNEVLAQVDYGMSNVHPWFANVSIDQAAEWTASFFAENNVLDAQSLPNKPEMFIAETGWPSNSSDISNESNGPSNASSPNLQIFLDTFVCQANTNGTGYFFFEFFDETWKAIEFGGVEGWWGLFYANKTLKPITIPDCHID